MIVTSLTWDYMLFCLVKNIFYYLTWFLLSVTASWSLAIFNYSWRRFIVFLCLEHFCWLDFNLRFTFSKSLDLLLGVSNGISCTILSWGVSVSRFFTVNSSSFPPVNTSSFWSALLVEDWREHAHLSVGVF